MHPDPSTPPLTFRRHGRLLQVLPGSPGLWVDVTQITTLGPPADDSDGVTLWIGPRPYALPIHPSALVQAIGDAQLAYERERAYEQELGRLMALDSGAVPAGETPPHEWDVDRPFG